MLEFLRMGVFSNEMSHGSVNLWVLVFVIGLTFLMLTNFSGYTQRYLSAGKLFLAVRFQISAMSNQVSGHLIDLSPSGATIVSDLSIAKGDALRLELSSLAGYPDSFSLVDGKVTSVRPYDESYIIRIRFDSIEAPKVLRHYLRTLTQGWTV